MAIAIGSTIETPAKIRQVIFASSVGTIIEWYDFYIFGSLATILGPVFFPSDNPTASLLATLATFGAGFAARPFGAVFFGWLGDLIGRKYAFLLTLSIMGTCTFLIGLLPSHAQIGILAPIILVLFRLIQGLALGGEYGGAAIYVAEHVPDKQRGYYTSFIQTTATLGLFISLLVILITRLSLGNEAFAAWGWRIPFILSVILLALSLYIRLRLKESPLFAALKDSGKTSTNPLRDAFANGANWKVILTVLFGAAAGQAVVWYTGQFYALSWLQTAAGLTLVQATQVVAIALAFGTPFFIVFGALSDRIGRKPIMMAGNLVAAILFIPIFQIMKSAAGPLKEVTTAAGKVVKVAADPNLVLITVCLFVLVLLVTMVYGPIAAFLVESFPAKIRYSSVSLPYHIGNGYFGGFLPLIATALVASTGNIYAGLYFPIAIALLTFVVGTFLLRESKDVSIHEEVHS
ncbi:MAG: MHS family MFS transporter [Thermaceae bacterium]|nr:MHS family MFS transporter [Thermaceae bacterium]